MVYIDRTPTDCITISNIKDTAIVDDSTILFYMRGGKLLNHWRISTAAERTSDEVAVLLQGFLALRGLRFGDIDGISANAREIAIRRSRSALSSRN